MVAHSLSQLLYCILQATSNDQAIFLAGYIYYDLSERLFSCGQILQVIILALNNLTSPYYSPVKHWHRIFSVYELFYF